MEDEFKQACIDYDGGRISTPAFRRKLTDIVGLASEDELAEFAEIAIAALGNGRH